MKKILSTLLFFFCFFGFAQNEQLANNYFDRGEFEKALVSYEELLKSQEGNFNYFQRTVECYQQLQQFEKANKAIEDRLDKFKQGNLLVELGYNFQLQKNEIAAKKHYEEAIDKIKKNPNCSILFYGKQEKIQLRLKTECKVHFNDDTTVSVVKVVG